MTNYKSTRYINPNLNILVPLAGRGSRFADAGYKDPKPFIPIFNRPMIQYAIETTNIIGKRFIFICLDEHLERLIETLEGFMDGFLGDDHPEESYIIVTTDGTTEGAACTALLAKNFINNDDPLCIYNSDQVLEWDANKTLTNFFKQLNYSSGLILCKYSMDPAHSFVSLGADGFVERVAEKQVISNLATTGHYFWSKGKYFVESAESMIAANDRYNNEFYIAPTFNYIRYKTVETAIVHRMISLGTPTGVKKFIEQVNYENEEHCI